MTKTNIDQNDFRPEKIENDSEAERVAKQIFAPLSQKADLTNREEVYKSLDNLLATDSQFKEKYDSLMNGIVSKILYQKLLEQGDDEEEVELSKAASFKI